MFFCGAWVKFNPIKHNAGSPRELILWCHKHLDACVMLRSNMVTSDWKHVNKAIPANWGYFRRFWKNQNLEPLSLNGQSHIGSWGQHGAHQGPVGPRWAPCWPHEPYYLGVLAKGSIVIKHIILHLLYIHTFMTYTIPHACEYTVPLTISGHFYIMKWGRIIL